MIYSQLRKQISIFVPLSDWKNIRLEAARLKVPMTELCRRWMKSNLSELQQQIEQTEQPCDGAT